MFPNLESKCWRIKLMLLESHKPKIFHLMALPWSWVTSKEEEREKGERSVEAVSHKFPYFSSMNWSSFSTQQTNTQITSNNGCTNTLLNKLFSASHRQHFPNMIYKTLHQHKNSFSHAPCHQSTKTKIYFVILKIQQPYFISCSN